MSTFVPVSQLAGTAEVAVVLGCAKQQITKLRQRGDFPEPVAMLAATPIWDLDEVRTFKESWQRRHKVVDTVPYDV